MGASSRLSSPMFKVVTSRMIRRVGVFVVLTGGGDRVRDHRTSRRVVSRASSRVSLSAAAGFWYHFGFVSMLAGCFLTVGYTFFMSRKRKFSDLV